MKVQVTHQTKDVVGTATVEASDLIQVAGRCAGTCYMKKSTSGEEMEKSIKRGIAVLKTAHHSIADHATVGVHIEGISKLLAMHLNSFGLYATSEKSGRYTEMRMQGEGTSDTPNHLLYNKWVELLKENIVQIGYDSALSLTLARENARYMLGILQPCTVMDYTATLRMWQYIIMELEHFDYTRLPAVLRDDYRGEVELFVSNLYNLGLRVTEVQEIKGKVRDLWYPQYVREHKNLGDVVGEQYTVNYAISVVGAAQLLRHRTLYYTMALPEEVGSGEVYVPQLVIQLGLEEEWIKDILSVKVTYPIGVKVGVVEQGRIQEFVEKLKERMCARVQLEVMLNTKETAEKLLSKYAELPLSVVSDLLPLFDKQGKPKLRCQVNGGCSEECGRAHTALTRII